MNPTMLEIDVHKQPNIKEEFKKFIRWYNEQFHLPIMSDKALALFYHSSYCCLETAKMKIEDYYTIRTITPEFFSNRDPMYNEFSEFQNIFNVITFVPLHSTREGIKVILGKFLNFDPNMFIYNDAIKFFNIVLDLCVRECGSMNSYIFILDIGGITLEHIRRIPRLGLTKFFNYIQRGAPIRWKGLHCAFSGLGRDEPAILEYIEKATRFNQFTQVERRFLSQVCIHRSTESLLKKVPVEILPKEMGGFAGPLMDLHKTQLQKIVSNRQLLLESERTIDERVRPGGAISLSEVFGPLFRN